MNDLSQPTSAVEIIADALDEYDMGYGRMVDEARTLVDCLELADDGRAHGVVFTLEMAPREVAR